MSKLGTVNINTHTFTSGVEFSIVKEATFSAGSPQTTTGRVSIKLNLSALVSGDTLEIRRYVGVNGGTVTAVLPNPRVIMAACMDEDEFIGGNAWDYTLKITSATSRALAYEVLQDVGDVNVVSIASGVIAAAAFAANAITSTVIAASAIGASQIASAAITLAKFAAGAIDSTILAANSIGSSQLAASAIGASQIASGAITAAKFATDAIDANAIASGAVTEIQSGLATSSALATVQADTGDIQARIPAALVGGRMSSDVGSWLGTAAATPTVAGVPKVEDATLQGRLTSGRGTLLDNLTRLDIVASTLATSSALATVQSDTNDIQSRLPATLDGQGNIEAGAKTISGAAKAEIADYVFGFIVDAGAPVDARTFAEQWRIARGVLVGRAAGLTAPAVATVETFRNADDTKDVATFTVGIDGTRTPGTLDGTP